MNRQFSTNGRLIFSLAAIAVAFLTLAGPQPSAEALETDICRVEILIDGKPLTEYAARGTTYIEALRGREYSIRLTNRSHRRIAVALAVDGLNSIDAKTTTPAKASKWVLGPRESTVIKGWQTSGQSARRFFFTTEEQSYGAWLDRTANLGVIEAVVYRERLPEPRDEVVLDAPSAAHPGPTERSRQAPQAEAKESGKRADDDFAATGIGRQIDHRVRRVRLELEDDPTTHVRLRYEYRKQLVYLGVLPSAEEEQNLARRERANGFSAFQFAPDPFDCKH